MSVRALRWESWALDDEADRRFRRIFAAVAIPLLGLAILVPLIHLQGVKQGGGTFNHGNYAQLLPSPKPAPVAPKVEEPKPLPKPKVEVTPPIKVKPLQPVKPIPKPKSRPKPVHRPAHTTRKAKPKPNPTVAARKKAQALLKNSGLDQLAGLRAPALTSAQTSRPLMSGQLTSKGGGGEPSTALQAINKAATSSASGGIGNASAAPITQAESGAGVGKRRTATVKSPTGFGRDHSKAGLNGDKPFNGRTLQEIQLVFDRNKAAFYTLYNRALRQNPNERGKIVVSLTIQPDGHVSACHMVYSSLGDPKLEREVVERVKMLHFKRKNVPAFTYPNYPIHFVPPA